MKTIGLKDLPLKVEDFALVSEYVERTFYNEWKMSRYEVSPQLIGVTTEASAKEIYGNHYAVKNRRDHIYIEVETKASLPTIIEEMNRYYHVWQLGKHFGGQHTEAEAHEIFDAYSTYFDNRDFPPYREAWNATKQDQAATELGLSRRIMCYISRQDDKLYMSSPELVYSTTDGIDVYVNVGGDKVSLWINPRYDKSIVGKALINNYNDLDDFEQTFKVEPPQRFSLGKLTPKKRDAWFAYIKAYYDAASTFFAERDDAVNKAVDKLKNAGFTQINDSREWKCSKGYFDCKATICNNGHIYTDISISYKANVRSEVFGI